MFTARYLCDLGLAVVATVVFFIPSVSHSAGVDCSPLDPRAQLSSTSEGKIQGSAETLLKVAKAGASIEGKVQREVKNLQEGVPISERANVQNRLIYVFCEMISKDDSPIEKKWPLYTSLLDRFNPTSAAPGVSERASEAKIVKSASAPAAQIHKHSTQDAKDRSLSQLKVDVFWCVGSNSAQPQAERVKSSLDSAFQLSRIRVRKLVANEGPWASGYEIRVDPDGSEDQAGKRLQRHLRLSLPRMNFTGWFSGGPTPGYLSVFVCPGAPSTEELDARLKHF